MNKRTNTAQWEEKYQRWRIAVQKDGVRKQFYSSTPGRTGQREANAKADAWLENDIAVKAGRVENVYQLWIEDLKLTTSTGNWKPVESRWRTWVLPIIGKKKVNTLTDRDLQTIINKAAAAGKSRKTLQLIASDLRAFCKYCRKAKLSTFLPEDVQIPASARYKGKSVLQPADLVKLFSIDTTLYRGKRVHDDFIHAYRFQTLTGLRPGELLGLRWADVQGNTVNVRRSINIHGEETQGKNQNAIRSFVLSGLARAVLEQQRAVTGTRESVFEIRSELYYWTRWQAYCKANGIDRISVYELRHTFVSVVKTLPEGEIKELVGHSQNMDTLGQYSHALTGDAENTALFQKLVNKCCFTVIDMGDNGHVTNIFTLGLHIIQILSFHI